MSTALSLFGGSTASSTSAAAAAMFSGTGGAGTTASSIIGAGTTGWGEIFALGTTNPWAAAGAIGAMSGNGWIFDPATLDGQQILSGNISGIMVLAAVGGTITFDHVVMRLGRRAVGGALTLLATSDLTGTNAIPTANTTLTMPNGALATANFATGEKAYMDLWGHVSANAAGTKIKVQESISTTQGFTGVCTLVTPGFQPIPSAGGGIHISDGFGGMFT